MNYFDFRQKLKEEGYSEEMELANAKREVEKTSEDLKRRRYIYRLFSSTDQGDLDDLFLEMLQPLTSGFGKFLIREYIKYSLVGDEFITEGILSKARVEEVIRRFCPLLMKSQRIGDLSTEIQWSLVDADNYLPFDEELFSCDELQFLFKLYPLRALGIYFSIKEQETQSIDESGLEEFQDSFAGVPTVYVSYVMSELLKRDLNALSVIIRDFMDGHAWRAYVIVDACRTVVSRVDLLISRSSGHFETKLQKMKFIKMQYNYSQSTIIMLDLALGIGMKPRVLALSYVLKIVMKTYFNERDLTRVILGGDCVSLLYDRFVWMEEPPLVIYQYRDKADIRREICAYKEAQKTPSL